MKILLTLLVVSIGGCTSVDFDYPRTESTALPNLTLFLNAGEHEEKVLYVNFGFNNKIINK